MCGVCGVWNFGNGEPVEPKIVEAMTRQMKHRGPDDEGFYIDGSLGLGHRRLSIIDLETGHQPLHNEDRTIWIVFNGEIYNYLSLRDKLVKAGHQFLTSSDTEVLVHAYEEYGDEFVEMLNGMFAFAVWDSASQRLLLARDRIGIKPLYYAEWSGRFLFGSELKAILAYPGIPRNIDHLALNQYLAFEYVPTPRSIFQNIRKLPPGRLLKVENHQVHVHQYWDLRLGLSEKSVPRAVDDYVTELREILEKVVCQEMVSDVPVGVLLSGGIDSSAVAAMMVRKNPGGVKSFSITFDDKTFDESKFARVASRHLGTEHHEMNLSPEMALNLIPRVVDFLDEPLGDSSIIPTYCLARFVSEHVKVALGGDGGDELFAGYSTLQAHKLDEYYRRLLPGPIRHRVMPWIVDKLPVSFGNISMDFKLRRFVSGQGESPIVRHHLWLGSFDPDQRRSLLKASGDGYEKDVDDLANSYARDCGAQDLLNQILYCDMKLYLEGDILPKVDRASMANSLEVRVPLLNATLVDFAEKLPHKLKIYGLNTKFLLRRAIRELLPASIYSRKKKGFNMPVAEWLTGPLRPLAEDMFSESRLKRQGLFEPSFVRTLFDEHLSRRKDHRKVLWTLLVFQLWYDRWGK
jgi:asparagine synthase (glutamine-hydrolysing)